MAPAPISDGPLPSTPRPSLPWHVEQRSTKSAWPAAASSATAGAGARASATSSAVADRLARRMQQLLPAPAPLLGRDRLPGNGGRPERKRGRRGQPDDSGGARARGRPTLLAPPPA